MKKTNLFLTLTAAIVMITGTSCTIYPDSVPEDSSSQIIVTVPKASTAETSKNSENTTNSESDSTSATTEPETVPADMEDLDIQQTAWKLYENAQDIYFGMVYTRQYFSINGNTIDGGFNEIADERVKTVADVKAEVRHIFAESLAVQYDKIIDEAYKEYNGKLYELQNGKGGDLYFENVELTLISSDENKAEFNAVAHYRGFSNITRKFTIIRENGMWKVSEFTNPTSEPHEDNVTTPTSNIPDEPDKAEMENLASNIYAEGMNLYFNIVINGSYGETNSNYIVNDYGLVFYEMSDPAITSIKDIEDVMRRYFTESCVAEMREKIANHYIEKDGKVYQCIAGKGGVFDKFDFKFEKNENDKAYFNVSVYGANGDNRIYDTVPHVLSKENGNWKISEYTYY